MNRYYPLIRREAIRLLAPTAIALYTLGYQMWALGGSFQLWLWKFSTYENYSMHPSTLLKMDWFAFALLIGMVLSLVQHAGERSARPSLWWEKLPYSRWERLCVKTVCSMVFCSRRNTACSAFVCPDTGSCCGLLSLITVLA